jgi:patatin-like phospholipase
MDQASEDARWAAWGPLRDRYRTRAAAGGPYRVLALDGGGIRGLITLPVLVRLESLLRGALGRGGDFRLCDFFECIGGTSTGAIIATGLARGLSARELLEFYRGFGEEVFRKRSILERWKALYDNGPLERKLREFFRDPEDLRPEHLRCLLVVVTRNATTDSAWPISSNPGAKYNERTRPDCNLNVPQWKIVRASTAAPVYFSPEVIQWDPDDPAKSFAFVDGGTTAYNCPAFLLARMVTEPAYGLGWPRGERKLGIVSIGTGSGPVLGATPDEPNPNIVSAAVTTLSALMSQAMFDQDINCRTVGRCVYGPPLDREVGDLVPRDGQARPIPLTTDLGRAFLYARYNAELTRSGLAALGLPELDPTAVSALDSTAHMDDLVRIGEAVARQVELEHFGALVGP